MTKDDLSKQEFKVLKGMIKEKSPYYSEEVLAAFAKVNVVFVEDITKSLSEKGLVEQIFGSDTWKVTGQGFEIMGETAPQTGAEPSIDDQEAPPPPESIQEPVFSKTSVPESSASPLEIDVTKPVDEILVHADFFDSNAWKSWIRPAILSFVIALFTCIFFYLIVSGPLTRDYVRDLTGTFVTDSKLNDATRDKALQSDVDGLSQHVNSLDKQFHYQIQKNQPPAAPAQKPVTKAATKTKRR